MGKAFVAKLAKEGARDPEALAAWIGRKKHGKAFGKLAAAGRKKQSSDKKPEASPEVRSAQAQGETPARSSLPSPEEQRAAGIASVIAASTRAAEQAQQEAAERRQRNIETLERINSAPGKPTRKAMTPEERRIVNYEAGGAALQDSNYERLRPFADESAQTNRVDVLKSRAFQKARQERIKNGWAVPGEDSPTPSDPVAPRTRNPVAGARARTAEQQRDDAARARLAEAAAARASTRENRPADVDAGVERVQALLDRYRVDLAGGRISRVSDQRLTGFAATLRTLQERDPAEFSRAETRALADFGHMVRTEAVRRGLRI